MRGENDLSKIYYHAQEGQKRNIHDGAMQTDISGMPSREVEQQEETSARDSLFADFRKQFAGDEEGHLYDQCYRKSEQYLSPPECPEKCISQPYRSDEGTVSGNF